MGRTLGLPAHCTLDWLTLNFPAAESERAAGSRGVFETVAPSRLLPGTGMFSFDELLVRPG